MFGHSLGRSLGMGYVTVPEDATNADAVLSIYETKGRPRFNPLIIHCADLAMAETLAEFSPLAHQLATLWPGSLTLVLPARANPNPQQLLVASDAVRNPGQPFTVNVQITEFQGGKRVDGTSLVTYSRTLSEGAQFASLVLFAQPARDAGKLMLKSGNDLWFFDPSTKASVRLSPQQRLLGQASNGDVVTVNLARDYRATLAAEEHVQDGERKTRSAFKLAQGIFQRIPRGVRVAAVRPVPIHHGACAHIR